MPVLACEWRRDDEEEEGDGDGNGDDGEEGDTVQSSNVARQ